MIIPIYNNENLPCITYPIDCEIEETERFLGGKALTGERITTINFVAISNAQALALKTFWEVDCNYGLNPFIIPLPFFGSSVDFDNPSLLVRFNGKIKLSKQSGVHTGSINLSVLGEIYYIIDNEGNFILNDNGDFIISDDVLVSTQQYTSYKRVSYGTY